MVVAKRIFLGAGFIVLSNIGTQSLEPREKEVIVAASRRLQCYLGGAGFRCMQNIRLVGS